MRVESPVAAVVQVLDPGSRQSSSSRSLSRERHLSAASEATIAAEQITGARGLRRFQKHGARDQSWARGAGPAHRISSAPAPGPGRAPDRQRTALQRRLDSMDESVGGGSIDGVMSAGDSMFGGDMTPGMLDHVIRGGEVGAMSMEDD